MTPVAPPKDETTELDPGAAQIAELAASARAEDLTRRWNLPAGAVPSKYALFSMDLDVPNWAVPQKGHLRIFQSDFLESLTVVHPLTPLAVFLPIIAYFLKEAWHTGLSFGAGLGLFAAGVFLWTFAEYAMHRGVFHFTPRSRWQVLVAYFMHGIHHAYPEDERRLVMPPVMSLTLALPFWLGFKAVFGTYYPAIFAGFLLGYLAYDMTHYAVHYLPMRSKAANWLRKHHMLHHYATPDRRYGVSSPLWDYVFRTAS